MKGRSIISRAARNPWLLVFTGIPFLAVEWALAHWTPPYGQKAVCPRGL